MDTEISNVIITDLNDGTAGSIMLAEIDVDDPNQLVKPNVWATMSLAVLSCFILSLSIVTDHLDISVLFLSSLVIFIAGFISSSRQIATRHLTEITLVLIRVSFYLNISCIIIFWFAELIEFAMGFNTGHFMGLSGALGGLGYGILTALSGYWGGKIIRNRNYVFSPEILMDYGDKGFLRFCVLAGIANFAFPFHSALLRSFWNYIVVDFIFILVGMYILSILAWTIKVEKEKRLKPITTGKLDEHIAMVLDGHSHSPTR